MTKATEFSFLLLFSTRSDRNVQVLLQRAKTFMSLKDFASAKVVSVVLSSHHADW